MKAINKGVANPPDWKPSENLPRAIDALRNARSVLCTMHRGPDGDALGSALALACALREMGRQVTVYNPDELPYNFRFLPGADSVARTVPGYEQQPLARMRLLADVLKTLEVHGKLATITITNEMMARTGSLIDLTDGFINYARSVDGVEVAASFREPSNGSAWRVSFRSRGRVNVAAIAQKFGGGGHHNAAGCSIEGDEVSVRAKIAQEVEEALKNGA